MGFWSVVLVAILVYIVWVIYQSTKTEVDETVYIEPTETKKVFPSKEQTKSFKDELKKAEENLRVSSMEKECKTERRRENFEYPQNNISNTSYLHTPIISSGEDYCGSSSSSSSYDSSSSSSYSSDSGSSSPSCD